MPTVSSRVRIIAHDVPAADPPALWCDPQILPGNRGLHEPDPFLLVFADREFRIAVPCCILPECVVDHLVRAKYEVDEIRRLQVWEKGELYRVAPPDRSIALLGRADQILDVLFRAVVRQVQILQVVSDADRGRILGQALLLGLLVVDDESAQVGRSLPRRVVQLPVDLRPRNAGHDRNAVRRVAQHVFETFQVAFPADRCVLRSTPSHGQTRPSCTGAGREIQFARNSTSSSRGRISTRGYDNGYPGLEIQAKKTEVFNNTVVNSRERVAIRINSKALGSVLRNNLVVTLDPRIRHPSLQFLGGTPSSFDVKLSHNFFYHAAKPDGRVLQTNEGNFTAAGLLAKYGTGKASQIVAPKFEEEPVRHYFLTAGSPGIDGGTDVGLPFAGKAPDVGWKELGSEADAPRYPDVMIDGKDDDAAILYLWGKSKAPPQKPKQQTSRSRVEDSLSRGMLCESKGDFTEATIWYHVAAHSDATETRRQKASDLLAALLARPEVAIALRTSEAEAALSRVRFFLGGRKKKVVPARHYLEVAQATAREDDQLARKLDKILSEIRSRLSSATNTGSQSSRAPR